MEYQRYNPEGWIEEKEELNKHDLENACHTGKVVQGVVHRYDEDCNLYVNLGNNIDGIIPRNEFDAISFDSDGNCKTNICKNKLNKYVQFKIKEIYKDKIILSRKAVMQDALNWAKEELEPGMVVNGIVSNIRKFGAFVEIGGGITRTSSY